MDWPSQSPDMNPVENVWAILKANVATHNARTARTLAKWIRYEWKRLPPECTEHLIKSMKTRVQTLIQVEGDTATY